MLPPLAGFVGGLVVEPFHHRVVVLAHRLGVAVDLVELPRDDDDGFGPVRLVQELNAPKTERRHHVVLGRDVRDQPGRPRC